MYRTIDASFWTDPKVRKLDFTTKGLFLYLVTNPHTHVSGLYYLPKLIAQHETGLAQNTLSKSADTLSGLRLCLFDWPNELVWVRKMFRYQGKGERNTLSAVHHIRKDIHNSFLINEFLLEYPEVADHMPEYPIDTISRVATPENGYLIPENGERISESTTTLKPAKPTLIPPGFSVTEEMKLWAMKPENGFTVHEVATETPAFVDHWAANGGKKLDWVAAWRNWMRNSRKFGGQKHGKNLFNGGGPESPGTSSGTTSRGDPKYIPKQ